MMDFQLFKSVLLNDIDQSISKRIYQWLHHQSLLEALYIKKFKKVILEFTKPIHHVEEKEGEDKYYTLNTKYPVERIHKYKDIDNVNWMIRNRYLELLKYKLNRNERLVYSNKTARRICKLNDYELFKLVYEREQYRFYDDEILEYNAIGGNVEIWKALHAQESPRKLVTPINSLNHALENGSVELANYIGDTEPHIRFSPDILQGILINAPQAAPEKLNALKEFFRATKDGWLYPTTYHNNYGFSDVALYMLADKELFETLLARHDILEIFSESAIFYMLTETLVKYKKEHYDTMPIKEEFFDYLFRVFNKIAIVDTKYQDMQMVLNKQITQFKQLDGYTRFLLELIEFIIIIDTRKGAESYKKHDVFKNLFGHCKSPDIVEYILNVQNRSFTEENVYYFDLICAYGSLEQVKKASEVIGPQYGNKATHNAMDLAAKNGNMEVVQFLHLNRPEQCSYMALYDNPHLNIIKYLIEEKETNSFGKYMTLQMALETADPEIMKYMEEYYEKKTLAVDEVHRNKKPLELSRKIFRKMIKKNTADWFIEHLFNPMEKYHQKFNTFPLYMEICQNGSLELLKSLFKYAPPLYLIGQKINIMDQAFIHGHYQLVDYLQTSDPHLDELGFSIRIHHLIGELGDIKLFDRLFKKSFGNTNVNTDLKTSRIENLVRGAVKGGNHHFIQHLIECGVVNNINSLVASETNFGLDSGLVGGFIALHDLHIPLINGKIDFFKYFIGLVTSVSSIQLIHYLAVAYHQLDIAEICYQHIKEKLGLKPSINLKQFHHILNLGYLPGIRYLQEHELISLTFMQDRGIQMLHTEVYPAIQEYFTASGYDVKFTLTRFFIDSFKYTRWMPYDSVNKDAKLLAIKQQNERMTNTKDVISEVFRNKYLMTKILKYTHNKDYDYHYTFTRMVNLAEMVDNPPYHKLLKIKLKDPELRNQLVLPYRPNNDVDGELSCNVQLSLETIYDSELYDLLHEAFPELFMDTELLWMALKSMNFMVFDKLMQQTEPYVLDYATLFKQKEKEYKVLPYVSLQHIYHNYPDINAMNPPSLPLKSPFHRRYYAKPEPQSGYDRYGFTTPLPIKKEIVNQLTKLFNEPDLQPGQLSFNVELVDLLLAKYATKSITKLHLILDNQIDYESNTNLLYYILHNHSDALFEYELNDTSSMSPKKMEFFTQELPAARLPDVFLSKKCRPSWQNYILHYRNEWYTTSVLEEIAIQYSLKSLRNIFYNGDKVLLSGQCYQSQTEDILKFVYFNTNIPHPGQSEESYAVLSLEMAKFHLYNGAQPIELMRSIADWGMTDIDPEIIIYIAEVGMAYYSASPDEMDDMFLCLSPWVYFPMAINVKISSLGARLETHLEDALPNFYQTPLVGLSHDKKVITKEIITYLKDIDTPEVTLMNTIELIAEVGNLDLVKHFFTCYPLDEENLVERLDPWWEILFKANNTEMIKYIIGLNSKYTMEDHVLMAQIGSFNRIDIFYQDILPNIDLTKLDSITSLFASANFTTNSLSKQLVEDYGHSILGIPELIESVYMDLGILSPTTFGYFLDHFKLNNSNLLEVAKRILKGNHWNLLSTFTNLNNGVEIFREASQQLVKKTFPDFKYSMISKLVELGVTNVTELSYLIPKSPCLLNQNFKLYLSNLK